MEPHLNDLIQYAFYGLFAFIGMRVVKSIDELNVKIAVVVARTDQHDKLFDKHDTRISKLEDL
jgi:hypothetical protein